MHTNDVTPAGPRKMFILKVQPLANKTFRIGWWVYSTPVRIIRRYGFIRYHILLSSKRNILKRIFFLRNGSPWPHIFSIGTLPETNIAPENGWLEYYFPFGARPIFRRVLLLVSGRVRVSHHPKGSAGHIFETWWGSSNQLPGSLLSRDPPASLEGNLSLGWVVLLPRIPVTTSIVMFLVGDPYKVGPLLVINGVITPISRL